MTDNLLPLPDHIPCPTAPAHIWLQSDPEPLDEGKPVYPANPLQGDVTWCWDKLHTTDTLYVRADIATPGADPHSECNAEIHRLTGLLAWGYSKLVYHSFADMSDCLAMDEIKLLVEHGV